MVICEERKVGKYVEEGRLGIHITVLLHKGQKRPEREMGGG